MAMPAEPVGKPTPPPVTARKTNETGALHILRVLRVAGHETYWAGGCVRDRLMGRAPKDYDIVTAAHPEQIESTFPKTVAIGKAFGVIGVIHDGVLYEVATFRSESGYQDGRRPNAIAFTDARADAERRDFTINALFYDPLEDRVLDFVGGLDDLRAKRLRTVGDPELRFAEDHLRMLRAIRFAHTLGFNLDPGARDAIQTQAERIKRISPERIREELTRILTESSLPGDALLALHETKLLKQIVPDVDAMAGVEQPPQFHPEGDVFTHTCIMLNLMTPDERSPELAWAIVLHDVGKPPTFRIGPGTDGVDRIRFDGHDAVGAQMAGDILRRLRAPNALTDTVVHCVRHHMRFMHVQEMRTAKLRAMIGAPTFPIEMALHRVDCLSSHGDLANYTFMRERQAAFAAEPVLPPAWIRGEDLMALGLREGPAIGRWIKTAYTRQLDGDFQDREAMLNWLREAVQNDNTQHD